MDVAKFLQNTPLFSALSKKAIWRLADLAQLKTFNKGDIIIKEGGSGTGCFIITQGSVEVIKNMDSDKPITVATLSKGEIIGEMNVIDEQPHSASIRAKEKTECIMISAWDFKAQMQAYPEIALQILPVLVRRLRTSENKTA